MGKVRKTREFFDETLLLLLVGELLRERRRRRRKKAKNSVQADYHFVEFIFILSPASCTNDIKSRLLMVFQSEPTIAQPAYLRERALKKKVKRSRWDGEKIKNKIPSRTWKTLISWRERMRHEMWESNLHFLCLTSQQQLPELRGLSYS